jgi:3-dehydroquinate synthase
LKKIRINIPEKSYNVFLGQDIFRSLLKIFNDENISGDILLVADAKVLKLYSALIKESFTGYKAKLKIVSITAKESNKSYESLKKIHSALIKNNFGRDCTIAALGGGILGDLAGFAASTYMRGVKYVQIPTTLLAAVDSSVGGKTGINFENVKNIIGTFHQPEFVIIDIDFFRTLPDEEVLCGIGEIIKYCFLTDKKYFYFVQKNIERIFKNDRRIIEKIIAESVKYKGDVVREDEKESGIRKVLNLGHTFAHAFEVEQKHKLKHGQAVIVGITCALYLSRKLNLIAETEFNEYLGLLMQSGREIRLSKYDMSRIIYVMRLDKKNSDYKIKFVMIMKIGEIITDVPADTRNIKKSISEALIHFK